MAALKRRKGTVRTAGGPQHRGPRHGGTRPILPGYLRLRQAAGQGLWANTGVTGAGVPCLGRGSTGPAEALPPLQAQPSPTSKCLPSSAQGPAIWPHFPPALGAVGPQAPQGERPPRPSWQNNRPVFTRYCCWPPAPPGARQDNAFSPRRGPGWGHASGRPPQGPPLTSAGEVAMHPCALGGHLG